MKNIFFVVLLLLSACTLGNQEEQVKIVVAQYPALYLAQEIGGNYADVINLLPSGSNPYQWKFSEEQKKHIADAQVLITFGTDSPLYTQAVSLGKGDAILVIAAEGKYAWFNIATMIEQGAKVRDLLTEQLPDAEQKFANNYQIFERKLTKVYQNYEVTLGVCSNMPVAIARDVLLEITDLYGIKFLPLTSGNQLFAQADARSKETVLQEVVEGKVSAVLVDSLTSIEEITELFAGTNVSIREFESLEAPKEELLSNGMNYLSLMNKNLEVFQAVFGCE